MKTEFPTLYKKNSRGKNQVWKIWVENTTPNPRYYTEYGQEDGKQQITFVDVKEGKNIGKSNETSPHSQCLAEAESIWKKKRDSGYDELATANFQGKQLLIRPMLAHKYQDHIKKVVFPCYGQFKYDGTRCIAVNNKLMSRKGKEYTSCPHIIEEIKELNLPQDLILDGELYSHDETFQDLMSFIRREDASEETKIVEYHVYDVFYPDGKETFKERLELLEKISKTFKHNLKIVNTFTINNSEDIDKQHDFAVENGYEGIMIRLPHGQYRMDKRSYELLKVKSFQDAEFKIVGAEANKGRCSSQCSLICETDEGAKFSVKPKGNEKQREQYWIDRDSNVGKFLTVRFFEWTTSTPKIPRFPIGINVRCPKE